MLRSGSNCPCCSLTCTAASDFTRNDRLFFLQLYRWFPSILKLITIVRPGTLACWRRAGFCCSGAGSLARWEDNTSDRRGATSFDPAYESFGLGATYYSNASATRILRTKSASLVAFSDCLIDGAQECAQPIGLWWADPAGAGHCRCDPGWAAVSVDDAGVVDEAVLRWDGLCNGSRISVVRILGTVRNLVCEAIVMEDEGASIWQSRKTTPVNSIAWPHARARAVPDLAAADFYFAIIRSRRVGPAAW